jgi:Carbohydrate family 9 binding domain-like
MLRLLALVPFAVLVPLFAIEPPKVTAPPLGYVCLKAEKSPAIDGKLDDDAWKAAPWSSDFVDIEGDAKPKPRHRTRMKMLWDEKALYIAAEIEEPHVWATLDKHDSVIFHDPDFEVFLDPDGDNHLYGELELNAKNTTWDLLLSKPYKDGGKALNGWEIIGLKTAVHVSGTMNDPRDKDVGWTVEIAWPWDGLKEMTTVAVPPKDGDRWRINFSRVQWDTTIENGKYVKVPKKPEYNWVWSPQGVIDMHRPERWGTLQFSTKTSGKVEYVPDAAQDLKDRLHELYYSQRDYHKKNGRYAKTTAELGWAVYSRPDPEIELTARGYEATMPATKSVGKRWGISHDSLLWSK